MFRRFTFQGMSSCMCTCELLSFGQYSVARNSFSISDELVAEKEKYKALSEELDSTYAELTGN